MNDQKPVDWETVSKEAEAIAEKSLREELAKKPWNDWPESSKHYAEVVCRNRNAVWDKMSEAERRLDIIHSMKHGQEREGVRESCHNVDPESKSIFRRHGGHQREFAVMEAIQELFGLLYCTQLGDVPLRTDEKLELVFTSDVSLWDAYLRADWRIVSNKRRVHKFVRELRRRIRRAWNEHR